MNKLDKWFARIIIVLALIMFCLLVHKQEMLNRKLGNIEFLQEQQSKTMSIILNTEVIVMYYSQPHTYKVVSCPVCFKYLTDWIDKELKAEYTSRDPYTDEEVVKPSAHPKQSNTK